MVAEWDDICDGAVVPLRHGREDVMSGGETHIVMADVSAAKKHETGCIVLVTRELHEHFDIELVNGADIVESAGGDDGYG